MDWRNPELSVSRKRTCVGSNGFARFQPNFRVISLACWTWKKLLVFAFLWAAFTRNPVWSNRNDKKVNETKSSTLTRTWRLFSCVSFALSVHQLILRRIRLHQTGMSLLQHRLTYPLHDGQSSRKTYESSRDLLIEWDKLIEQRVYQRVDRHIAESKSNGNAVWSLETDGNFNKGLFDYDWQLVTSQQLQTAVTLR